MFVRCNPMLWKTSLAWQRLRRSWILSLHSSTARAFSGPNCQDPCKESSSFSTEKLPHTPVMVKEVLEFLDLKPGQVCLHLLFLFFFFVLVFNSCTPNQYQVIQTKQMASFPLLIICIIDNIVITLKTSHNVFRQANLLCLKLIPIVHTDVCACLISLYLNYTFFSG